MIYKLTWIVQSVIIFEMGIVHTAHHAVFQGRLAHEQVVLHHLAVAPPETRCPQSLQVE
jgi:hypothetical protein